MPAFWSGIRASTVQTIDRDRIVGEDNTFAVGLWFTQNFRAVLREYCQVRSALGPFGCDTVKQFSGLLLSAGLGLTVGPAVGISVWLLLRASKEWCDQYGPKSYAGTGSWDANISDENGAGYIPVDGQFDLTYSPAIRTVERGRNRKKMMEYQIHIHVPPILEGRFALTDGRQVSMRDAFIQFKDPGQGKDVSCVGCPKEWDSKNEVLVFTGDGHAELNVT